MIGYRLKPGWLFVIGPSSVFLFHDLEALIGLDLALFTQAARALEPPQANVLLV